MNFAGRNHGCDSTVQVAVDPSDLILPWSPITGDGMDVAVDQAGGKGCAFGVDDEGCAFGIDVFLLADRGDFAVDGEDSVGVEDGMVEVAAEQEANVVDQKPRAAEL